MRSVKIAKDLLAGKYGLEKNTRTASALATTGTGDRDDDDTPRLHVLCEFRHFMHTRPAMATCSSVFFPGYNMIRAYQLQKTLYIICNDNNHTKTKLCHVAIEWNLSLLLALLRLGVTNPRSQPNLFHEKKTELNE